jgi:TldD protein
MPEMKKVGRKTASEVLRIRKIGNSLGLILSKELLARLKGVPVGVGQPTLRMDRITVGGTGG